MEMENSPSGSKKIKTGGAGGPSFSVPEEIIEEILSRAAVKSVLRFRCVSKSWQSTIDSERFIKKHQKNSTRNTRLGHGSVILASEPAKLSQCSAVSVWVSLFNKPDILDLEFKFPSKSRSISLVGCCNGVVCVFLNGKDFILCNPSTRISKKLPPAYDDGKVSEYNSLYGFCYDESSDDYKILLGVHLFKGSERKVYSLKSDSWKTTNRWDSRSLTGCLRAGKAVNGKLHWLGHRAIVAIDLSRETHGVCEKPDYDTKWKMHQFLGKLGECLALTCCFGNGRMDVWVMKEYGVKESWQKIVDYHFVDRNWQPFCVTPLFIGPQGEITIMQDGSFLIVYPDGWQKRMGKHNLSYKADFYYESLVQL